MTPRRSRHNIHRVRFAPLNLVTTSLEGITVLAPGISADLVHAHNRIPIGPRKFIISFESHLPRRFAFPKDNFFTRYMTRQLKEPSCRRIIAMSHFAKRAFLQQQEANPNLHDLTAKLLVRHPNVFIPPEPKFLREKRGDCDRFSLIFVGAHFGRKGGCVAVKVAEKAAARKLPIHVTIISSLAVGGKIWTDPVDRSFFEPYFDLLTHPNVTFYGALPNAKVLALLRASDFCLLPTFADTFGFSAIEAMAEGTPVIGTRICALPEFIKDGANGILLDLETTPIGEWKNPGWDARGTEGFVRYFRDEVERLSDEIILRLEGLLGKHDRLLAMQRSAYHKAKVMFDAESAADFWDDLYEEVARESPRMPVRLLPTCDISSAD